MSVIVGSGFSASPAAAAGVAEAAHQAAAGLQGAACDLALVFIGGDLIPAAESVLEMVEGILQPRELIGTTAGGLIADGEEHVDGSGVTVWAIALGDRGAVEIFELRTAGAAESGVALIGIPDPDGIATSAVILLADASRLPLEATLRALEERFPTVPVIGGVPSLVPSDGQPLLRGSEFTNAAAIGVRFSGIDILPCVSQGARPIGPELTVTAGGGGVINQLAGRPAIDALRDTVDGLPAADREQIRHGLLLGLVVGPSRPEYGPGDFIVRGLAGADPDSGAVAVGAPVAIGQVVRLHVRDPQTASTDLEDELGLRRDAAGTEPVAGALAFTCNGRGRDMFGHDHHDARAIQKVLGPIPLAGMVSAGEIGPVGGRPFAHSFTATIAVFLQ